MIDKIIKPYLSGLISCVSVIGGGHDLSIRKVDCYNSKGKNINDSYFSILKLPSILFSEIIKFKINSINFNYSEVWYAGHTENNKKEFDFFYSVCKAELSDKDYCNDINNISSFEKSKMIKPKNNKIIIFKFFMSIVLFFVFFLQKIKMNNTSLKYTLDYTKYFILYYINFKRNKMMLPSVIILSNDHNPQYVAISKVARIFSIDRVYLQHASVNNKFPSLDFEMSVLRDKLSENIYENIGFIKGDIVRVSRSETRCEFIESIVGDKVDVIITPTSVFDENKLSLLILELERNDYVNAVYIKAHPRTELDYDLRNKFNFISNIDTNIEDKIIIAGNSSVALELMLKGYRVYQCFEIDDIEDDYYQYVANGLLPSISFLQLSNFNFLEVNEKQPDLSLYSPIFEGVQEEHLLKLKAYIKSVLSNTARFNKFDFEEKLYFFIKKNRKKLMAIFSGLSMDESMNVLTILYEDNVITKDEYNLILKYLS